MAARSTSRRSAEALAELLEHLVRRIHGAGFSGGLVPAQWSALRFLHRANPTARTLSSFTRFHAASKGTAAQTLRALRTKGLIRQRQSTEDRRVRYYELTEKGRLAMADDPLRPLVGAIERMSDADLSSLAVSLQGLVGAYFAAESNFPPRKPAPAGDD